VHEQAGVHEPVERGRDHREALGRYGVSTIGSPAASRISAERMNVIRGWATSTTRYSPATLRSFASALTPLRSSPVATTLTAMRSSGRLAATAASRSRLTRSFLRQSTSLAECVPQFTCC
jgi:hypothetical protein